MNTYKTDNIEETKKRVAAIQEKNEGYLPFVTPSVPILMRAMVDGIKMLDEKSQATVMKEVGRVCAIMTREERIEQGAPVPTSPLPLDEVPEAVRAIAQAGGLEREMICKREGDTIIIKDTVGEKLGGCCCRLVLAGVIDPSEKLCKMCETGYYEEYMTHMTGKRPIKIVTEGISTGSRFCSGICTFEHE